MKLSDLVTALTDNESFSDKQLSCCQSSGSYIQTHLDFKARHCGDMILLNINMIYDTIYHISLR